MTNSKFSHLPKKVPVVDTKYRKIITPIPVPESLPLLQRGYQNESRSMHGQMPIIWDRADGFQVYDQWGNKWIDFSSTIFLANAGHGNKRIVSALRKVLDKPLLHTYTYFSDERLSYLEYLIQNTPEQFEKAFLLSSGTEATEAALKLMRLQGRNWGKRRNGIICFDGNWHGRTVGAQLMGANVKQKEWIGYLDRDIYHLPFPYPWVEKAARDPREYFREAIAELIDLEGLNPKHDLCGIMMETFQGWGAVFYPKEFVKEVEIFARENQLLLAFDEIQSGFGRTGELFGYMHYGVRPDIVCCGKGASSSVPLSIVLGAKDVMDLPEIGSMSSTHSANPVACAAGLANLEALLEDGLIDNSRRLGKLLHKELNRIKDRYPAQIGWVQGEGLLAGLILNSSKEISATSLCNQICETSLQRGLILVNTGRESIKIGPPLCINEEGLLEGIQVIESAIQDCLTLSL